MELRSKVDVQSFDQAIDGLKGTLRTLYLSIIGGIIWTLVVMPLLFFLHLINSDEVAGAVFLFGWGPAIWIYNKLRKAYKEVVIEPLFKQLEPSTGLHYSREGSFDKDDFNRLKTFKGAADEVKTEDFISGTVDGIDFQSCEVKAKDSYRDSKGRKRSTTIFRGEIYTIKMKEPLKADVFISPDFAEAKLGGLGRFLQKMGQISPDFAEAKLGGLGRFLQKMGQASSDQKVVRMENAEFERLFKVISDDDVGTRYFLTPRFMERIVDARNHHKKAEFYLETQDDTIYLMISGAPDKFEPHITVEKIKSGIYKDIDAIEITLGIIKSLNLDLHHINVNAKKTNAAED